MMGWYGWGPGTSWLGWLIMSLMMLAFWGLLVAGIVWLVRSTRAGGDIETRTSAPDAQQILDERLARGELTEEEYLRRRDLLRAR